MPAYCVGDIAHHIAQSTYNMCKDDVIMAVIESVTEVMDKTLHAAAPKIKTENEVLALATGSSASAAEYLLELDGFNAIMVVDMLTKRYHNYVQLYPKRGADCRTAQLRFHGHGVPGLEAGRQGPPDAGRDPRAPYAESWRV